MVNYACALSQSESGKYFEWIIMLVKTLGLSKLVYAASMPSVPEMVIKRVQEKIIKCFGENKLKNDKIKRSSYISISVKR